MRILLRSGKRWRRVYSRIIPERTAPDDRTGGDQTKVLVHLRFRHALQTTHENTRVTAFAKRFSILGSSLNGRMSWMSGAPVRPVFMDQLQCVPDLAQALTQYIKLVVDTSSATTISN